MSGSLQDSQQQQLVPGQQQLPLTLPLPTQQQQQLVKTHAGLPPPLPQQQQQLKTHAGPVLMPQLMMSHPVPAVATAIATSNPPWSKDNSLQLLDMLERVRKRRFSTSLGQVGGAEGGGEGHKGRREGGEGRRSGQVGRAGRKGKRPQ